MISARPPDNRSTVAKSWYTRTGSSELKTVTALASFIFLVTIAAAASINAGDEQHNQGGGVRQHQIHPVPVDLLI